MKKVTIWLKGAHEWDEKKENKVLVYRHNHIEDDWVDGDKPKPLKPEFEAQKHWSKDEWKKEFAYLDENYKVVPHV